MAGLSVCSDALTSSQHSSSDAAPPERQPVEVFQQAVFIA